MTEPVEQVRFASNIDCDGSVKTDKRNNLRRRRKNRNNQVSGIRSKFVLEAVRQELYHLQQENEQLRSIIMHRINPPDLAEQILLDCQSPPVDIFLRSSILMEEDETKYGEDETKHEETESYEPSPASNHTKQSTHLVRIGQEINILESPASLKAPLEEFSIPCREEKCIDVDKFTMSAFEFDVEDTEQCLANAFASEYAF